MKKAIPFALFLIVMLSVNAQQVVEDNYTQLRLNYATPEVYADGVELCGEKYLNLTVEGYMPGGQIGAPQVPVLCNLLTVPFCTDMEVVVENEVYDTLHLGTSLTLLPMQPSRSKSDRSDPVVVIDREVYSTDAFVGGPVATVEAIGVARDRRLAQLTFSPVRVNPVSGDVIVCRKAEVTVRYIEADSAATVNHFRRYHTPAFSAGNTVNSLLSSKDANNPTPIRMVIVAKNTLRCRHLEAFADWKRTQGMRVDLHYYTQNMNTQTAAQITEEIASYLKGLYDNASDTAPAPTYLLLVGDNDQLKAFSSKLSGGWSGPDNDHITDLYFTTWTSGDNLPDCYWGRFSATDTATIANIVTKTLLYEKYDFANDDYLARAALIAGVDQTWSTNTSDNGYTYADPNMDYAARYYVNADHGFDEVTYYKNNTSFAPDGVTVTGSSRPSSTASSLRLLYSGGVGWINYTAHGDWDEWSCPEFTVSHVSSMNNTGMPSFMIGNCCLSNKFDKGVCFGESLIRRGNNQGAIGYIGGTNSTYWTQDFYWSVGIRSNISNTMNTTYSPSNKGIYDRLFHTHGEDFSDYAVTAGKIVYNGNLSVQNSSSTSADMKKYYWEIYELMGDPSLMPWLGKAKTMDVTLNDDVVPMTVHTVPHAYVSLIDSVTLEVYAATFTDANGDGQLNVSSSANTSAAFLSAIAQGYKPFFSRNINLDIDNPTEAAEVPVHIYPNPAVGTCRVHCESMSLVQLFDCRGSLVGTYTPLTDSVCVIDVSNLPLGIYMVQVQTSDTIGAAKLIVR